MNPVYLAYGMPLMLIVGIYILRTRRAESRSRTQLAAAHETGLTEPMSLHPVIDKSLCVGCGACVRACPEGEILGLVGGRAELVEPSQCIGHGACRSACPLGAITLVLGTATRGVDIPHLAPNFETNVPGIFIAGELGGMGLIRNAVEQGRQTIASVAARGPSQTPGMLDVLIVGAGPAGISASLAAIEQGLTYATIEQDSFGGTVAHFPRRKLVMTAPAELPLIGRMPFREVSKERLLDYWTQAAHRTGLRIAVNERVEAVVPAGDGFAVSTTRSVHYARSVVLAIGRRGTPRRLDVEGEEHAKVVYRLVDPAQYRGLDMLVVGGGDSALEAAASLAQEQGTRVTLSYRGAAFSRAKATNRDRVAAAVREGRIEALLPSQVRRITPDGVLIEHGGRLESRRNDGVIVCTGGTLPTGFLKSIGITVETKHGTA
jgi:thioredoxin reductase (NADPH)